jgi:hypothetical protein
LEKSRTILERRAAIPPRNKLRGLLAVRTMKKLPSILQLRRTANFEQLAGVSARPATKDELEEIEFHQDRWPHENIANYLWYYVEDYPLAKLGSKEMWIKWIKEEDKIWESDMGERGKYLKQLADKYLPNMSKMPIIVSEKGDSPEIWDGYHRIGIALFAGVEKIPAYVGIAQSLQSRKATEVAPVTPPAAPGDLPPREDLSHKKKKGEQSAEEYKKEQTKANELTLEQLTEIREKARGEKSRQAYSSTSYVIRKPGALYFHPDDGWVDKPEDAITFDNLNSAVYEITTDPQLAGDPHLDIVWMHFSTFGPEDDQWEYKILDVYDRKGRSPSDIETPLLNEPDFRFGQEREWRRCWVIRVVDGQGIVHYRGPGGDLSGRWVEEYGQAYADDSHDLLSEKYKRDERNNREDFYKYGTPELVEVEEWREKSSSGKFHVRDILSQETPLVNEPDFRFGQKQGDMMWAIKDLDTLASTFVTHKEDGFWYVGKKILNTTSNRENFLFQSKEKAQEIIDRYSDESLTKLGVVPVYYDEDNFWWVEGKELPAPETPLINEPDFRFGGKILENLSCR